MKFKNYISILFITSSLMIVSCASKKEQIQDQSTDSLLTVQDYGTFNNKAVKLYTLKNKNGMEMSVMNYGGIIVSLKVPDINGKIEDIVLGHDSLNQYVKSTSHFGALIGRYGNRIAKGKFKLNGTEHSLDINDGENHLHGGAQGFDKVYWDIKPDSTDALILTYQSKDGEQGYPGNLNAEVRYTLTNENELKINYTATTDKTTIVNLTQHSYFNLSGKNSEITNHFLQIDADHFLPVGKGLIPTGKLSSVEKTPFDFRKIEKIGKRIEDKNEQLKLGKGYDHCWVLNNKSNNNLSSAATLIDSASGRKLEVLTTEPGLQFYSGNFLDGKSIGKEGKPYQFRSGLCLETQHFPDSPNQSKFPSVVLNPGEKYSTTTIYKFSVIGNQ